MVFSHSDRVKRGMARARLNGKHIGRPVSVASERDAEYYRHRAAGFSFREIAYLFKTSVSAVQCGIRRHVSHLRKAAEDKFQSKRDSCF